jgi:hypothetical protein
MARNSHIKTLLFSYYACVMKRIGPDVGRGDKTNRGYRAPEWRMKFVVMLLFYDVKRDTFTGRDSRSG